MDKVYICHTFYQVYISIVKEIKSPRCADIILADTIPDSDKLINSLKKSKIFLNVFKFPELVLKKTFNEEKIEFKPFRGKKLIKLFENNFTFKEYKEIYIYNDWTIFGSYLIDKKIRYHLIEDGLDAFYYIKGNLDFFQKIFYPNFFEKSKKNIKKFLNCGYDYFGTSKYAIDIEVNDISKIFIPHDKVLEVPKSKLLNELTDEEKRKIYGIFVNENITLNPKSKKLLLLTQPLFIDKMINRMEDQIEIYKKILDEYGDGYSIYIKPHPRDLMEYEKELKDYNVRVISKNIPTEILNYNDKVLFDLGITITSSSIRGMECIKKKLELGFEFLKKYKD